MCCCGHPGTTSLEHWWIEPSSSCGDSATSMEQFKVSSNCCSSGYHVETVIMIEFVSSSLDLSSVASIGQLQFQFEKWGRATRVACLSLKQRSMSRWCSANKKGGKISRHSRCGQPSIENGGHFSSVSSCPVSSTTTSVALFLCYTTEEYNCSSSVQNQNQKRKSRTWEIYSEALFSTRQQQLLNFKVWSVEYR